MPLTKTFRSPWVLWLFLGGLIYAWILTQGLPLWDDDFTSWFSKIQDRSILSLIGEWLSPVSTQPQYWGFNERPLQKLIYKSLQAGFGYQSWAYYLFKDLVYAGLGVMIYLWGLRLVPPGRSGRWAALAAAIVFLLAPGPLASLLLYADYAPVAELIFLSLTYVIWAQVEATPASWTGLPDLKNLEQRNWLLRWVGIAVLTYLGYKSKADIKLVPGILALYVLVLRRKQLAYFAVPIGIMALLAVPWGGAALAKLPPFLPGSHGSEVAWMWQPPSLERLREFFWSSQGYDWWTTLREPSLSLAAVLGPFLIAPLIAFLLWRMEAFDRVPWRRLHQSEDRARLWVLIWLVAVIAAISSLAAINYTFRIRYGILPMVPVALLLAWGFGRVAESAGPSASAKRLPQWALGVLLAGLALQCAINLERSVRYRHDMGQVMISIDQVYDEVAQHHANERLALMPDFRPYDYRPDAPAVFASRQWLGDGSELVKKGFPEDHTVVISWSLSLWERLELLEHFSGCRGNAWVDLLMPCKKGTGTWLMRYIAADPEYAQGEALRSKGDLAGARKHHEAFLTRHPGSAAGYFVVGLEAYQLKDFARAEQAYGWLEERLPEHMSILYNHALAYEDLGRFKEAMPRLEFIVSREPNNYAALLHLYWDYRKDGQGKRAHELLLEIKRMYPQDGAIDSLLKEG